MQPTNELYGALKTAYDHFNKTLFDGRLPHVLFTVQRQKGVMGYFSYERWVSKNGDNCHEIAINPAYVAKSSLIDFFQTLVHEQCHLLQYIAGTPGRRGYHNKEFADMMQNVGLMPSDTGREGGKTTGERMSDYPIPGGKFLKECEALVNQEALSFPWFDRYANATVATLSPDQIKGLNLSEGAAVKLTSALSDFLDDSAFIDVNSAAASKQKSKYSCSGCGSNVWGKPNMFIKCGHCELSFDEI